MQSLICEQVSTLTVSSAHLLSNSALLCQSSRVSTWISTLDAKSNLVFRSRCYRPGPIWYRKDRNFLYLCPSKAGPKHQAMPGPHSCTNPRACTANSEGGCCHWRFHEYWVPCMHWWYQRAGWHEGTSRGPSNSRRNSRSCPRHDPAQIPQDRLHEDVCSWWGRWDAFCRSQKS